MAIVSNNTRLDIANKVSLGISSTYNNMNWFEERYPWTPQLHVSDIFVDAIPFAADMAQAELNVIANPTLIAKINSYQMDELPASNGQAYGLFQTPGNTNSQRLKDFVSPQKWGAGYVLTLRDSTNSVIPLTDGAWQFDHHNGVLRFDETNTPAIRGYSLPLRCDVYQYIGDVLGGGGSSGGGCPDQEEKLVVVADNQTVFTLGNVAAGTSGVYLNGQFWGESVGYTIVGTTFTWLNPPTASAPGGLTLLTTDELIVKYCSGVSGGPADVDAIHTNIAAEIVTIAEKLSPVGGDLLVIEDSEDSNKKKRISLSSIVSNTTIARDVFDINSTILMNGYCDLANTPVANGETVVWRGVVLTPGVGYDYTISTNRITFTAGSLGQMAVGDVLNVQYAH